MPPPSLAAKLADALADGGWRARARHSQLPPSGNWNGWLIKAGRGFGKTWVGSNYTNELAEAGTVSRIALIGATAADVRDIMIEGPAGILRTAPKWFEPTFESSKRKLAWPNGAIAHAFSAEEADRLRGPQFDFGWCDEFAAWQGAEATWSMFEFALRLGAHPRWLVTTTPRPIKIVKELLARPDVVVTSGSTFENADNLAPSFLDAIKARYAGTRLGRQELNAEVLDDTPGALWSCINIDQNRIRPDEVPTLIRIVVAIDPAVTSNEDSDETGLIVAGMDQRRHIYVVEDGSGIYKPHEWAQRAIALHRARQCDLIVGEVNNGGEMVESTLRVLDAEIPFRAVHASRGKLARAEPIATKYERNEVHHVGVFPQLEDQMCAFTTDFDRKRSGYSPDRMDALVWACSDLMTPVIDDDIGGIISVPNWPAKLW